MWCEVLRSILSNFPIDNTVSLTTFTILCITFPEFIYLPVRRFVPFDPFHPLPHLPFHSHLYICWVIKCMVSPLLDTRDINRQAQWHGPWLQWSVILCSRNSSWFRMSYCLWLYWQAEGISVEKKLYEKKEGEEKQR